MICCLIVILFLYSFLNQLMMEILGFIIVFMAISYLRPSEEWGKLLFYTRRTFEEKICVDSMEFQKNGHVKITLKKLTLRRTVYLNLKPGDELSEAALKRGRGA